MSAVVAELELDTSVLTMFLTSQTSPLVRIIQVATDTLLLDIWDKVRWVTHSFSILRYSKEIIVNLKF